MNENDNEKTNKNDKQNDEIQNASAEQTLEGTEKQISDLKKAVDKAKTDHLYLLAEFDNYRKNAIKERSDLMKFGAERLARDLVGVLDNFERALALEVNAENYQQFVSGIKMTEQELISMLKKNGIEEIPSKEMPFDPNHHEAISSEPTDQYPPGVITQVFRKPYKIYDRILRTGQVVVATETVKPS